MKKNIFHVVIKLLFCGILITSFCASPALECSAYYTPSSQKLTINSYITISKGSTYQLNPTLNGSKVDTSKLNYQLSNTKVLRVDSTGLVTALKKGSCRVTITDQSNSASSCQIKIYVGKRATKLRLNTTKKSIYVDNYYMLKASVSPSQATLKKVRFESSKPTVAKVSSKGKITAVSPGTAIITVSTVDGSNLSKTCTITVLKGKANTTEDDEDYDFFLFDTGSKQEDNVNIIPSEIENEITSNKNNK